MRCRPGRPREADTLRQLLRSRKARASAWAFFVLAIATGCPNGYVDSSAQKPAEVSLKVEGTWDLYSINGTTLPAFLVNNAQQRYEVLTESYVLRNDLTWTRTQ